MEGEKRTFRQKQDVNLKKWRIAVKIAQGVTIYVYNICYINSLLLLGSKIISFFMRAFQGVFHS